MAYCHQWIYLAVPVKVGCHWESKKARSEVRVRFKICWHKHKDLWAECCVSCNVTVLDTEVFTSKINHVQYKEERRTDFNPQCMAASHGNEFAASVLSLQWTRQHNSTKVFHSWTSLPPGECYIFRDAEAINISCKCYVLLLQDFQLFYYGLYS